MPPVWLGSIKSSERRWLRGDTVHLCLPAPNTYRECNKTLGLHWCAVKWAKGHIQYESETELPFRDHWSGHMSTWSSVVSDENLGTVRHGDWLRCTLGFPLHVIYSVAGEEMMGGHLEKELWANLIRSLAISSQHWIMCVFESTPDSKWSHTDAKSSAQTAGLSVLDPLSRLQLFSNDTLCSTQTQSTQRNCGPVYSKDEDIQDTAKIIFFIGSYDIIYDFSFLVLLM